jgi:hypothetical protein
VQKIRANSWQVPFYLRLSVLFRVLIKGLAKSARVPSIIRQGLKCVNAPARTYKKVLDKIEQTVYNIVTWGGMLAQKRHPFSPSSGLAL